MSRIGKQPVIIPAKVEVKYVDSMLTVKGPKGELKQLVLPEVNLEISDKEILVSVKRPKIKTQRAYWGLYQRLISNMVKGVTEGFEKKMEMIGVGYKAQVQGKTLVLNVAFSHPVNFPIAEGLNISVDKNVITINGIDKQLVGEAAANLRKIRKPEPYKGKGIKYIDEIVRRKDGKKVGAK
ncbi:MAG: 50S ribosomal protein L6 [Patescibacteria group bacterium]